MKKIRSGLMFFYRKNGAPSTVVSVVMKEMVDGGVLKQALDEAIKRYPYLKTKIVKKDASLYLEDNTQPLIVRNSAEDISLGSKENNDHLIDVHFDQQTIYVNFHHGVCDGTGIMPFVRTLIYCYCRNIYGSKENLGAIRLPDSPLLEGEEFDPCETTTPIAAEKPAVSIDTEKLYCLPELQQEYETSYHWQVDIPVEDMLPYMKENDGSPSALISLFLCKAVETVHPEHNAPIASSVAWNCRKELGAENTRQMCVSSVVLEYDERMKDASVDRQLTCFRGKIFAQQMLENAYQMCNGIIMLSNMVDSKNTIEEKFGIMDMFANHINKTFLVSYVGQMEMGDYEPYIDGVYIYGSGTKGLSLEVVALKDNFCIQFLQSFSGEAYLQNFCAQLAEAGIHTRVSECQKFTTPRAAMWEKSMQ